MRQVGGSRLIIAAAAIIVALAGSVAAQAPADPGIQDTLMLQVLEYPVVGQDSTQFAIQLWAYSDSLIKVVASGFKWDNDKVRMDSAYASLLVSDNLDGGVFFYDSASIDQTNLKKRFIFGGFRVIRPGLPGDASVRRLWATYYFTAFDWQADDYVTFDTTSWNTGSQLIFVSEHNQGYQPIFTGPLEIGEPDTTVGYLVNVFPGEVRIGDTRTLTIVGHNTKWGTGSETIVRLWGPDTTMLSPTPTVISDTVLTVTVAFTPNLPVGPWDISVQEVGVGEHWLYDRLYVLPAQGSGDPNDPGIPDTVMFNLAWDPAISLLPQQIELQLWVFSDESLGSSLTAFDWDNDNLHLDSAIPSALMKQSYDLIINMYDGDVETSNLNKRFAFAGAALLNYLPPDSVERRLWGTYYFTLSSWQAGDVIVIDSTTLPPMNENFFHTNQSLRFHPILDVPFVYQPAIHAPEIVSISPNTGAAGDTVYTTITGNFTNFVPLQTTARLFNGSQSIPSFFNEVQSGTSLISYFALPDTASEEPYSVGVTVNGEPEIVGPGLFSVSLSDTVFTVRRVPQDYVTIQSAIDAANDGDLILVGPGTYGEMIDFMGKSLSLTSVAGPDSTFIVNDELDSLRRGDVRNALVDTLNFNLITITGAAHASVEGFTLNGWISVGGISAWDTDDLLVTHCNFVSCGATKDGGAIWAENTGISIDNCTFENNYAPVSGSAVFLWNCAHPNIVSNEFYDNNAGNGTVTLIDCIGGLVLRNMFVRNSAAVGSIRKGTIDFVGCADFDVWHNTVDSCTGGVTVYESSRIDIRNNIFSYYSAYGIQYSLIVPLDSNVHEYNLVYSFMTPDRYIGTTAGLGELDLPPLLGPDKVPQATSPCVDAGDPHPMFNDPDSSRADIGAKWFEGQMPSGIHRVPQDYATIQAAIDAAEEHDTVLVAPGTYYENLTFRGRDIWLVSEYILDHDTTKIHSTVIDGSHLTRGDSLGSVISVENIDTWESWIVGFTIQGGKGQKYPFQSPWTDRRGGGLHVVQARLNVTDCLIQGNNLSGTHNRGGGVYLEDTTGNYYFGLARCTVRENNLSATNSKYGAGLFSIGMHISINNNRIANNGGIALSLFDDVHGAVTDNMIVDNDSTGIETQTQVQIIRNTILRNGSDGIWANYSDLDLWYNIIADNGGYGVVSRASNLDMQNNTIVSNAGGGIYKFWSNQRNIDMLNDIVWYNGDGGVGSQIRLDETVTLQVEYCDVEGGAANIFQGTDSVTVLWAQGNITGAPMFVDTLSYNYALDAGSPCIDAGHPGMSDPDGSRIDMGAIPSGQSGELFSVEPSHIEATLYPGSSATRQIVITNESDTNLTILLRVEPAIITFDSSAVNDDGGRFNNLGPGLYNGTVAWPEVAPSEPVVLSGRQELQSLAASTARAGAIVFFDDMESGTNGWTSYATVQGLNNWQQAAAVGVDGSTAWRVRQHENFGSDALQTPAIDLRGLPQAMLTFDHRYGFDECDMIDFEADGGIVEISIDSGATWEQIYPVGGYPYTLDDICNNPLAYYDAYSHSTNQLYVPESFDLTPWANNIVWIRFHSGWDCGNCIAPNDGWYIDNFMVTSGSFVEWLSVDQPSVNLAPGASASVTALFETNGLPMGLYDALINVYTEFPRQAVKMVFAHMEINEEQVHPTNEWIALWCDRTELGYDLVQPGTVISAFDPDGVLCGQDVVRDSSVFGFMPVYRDDPFTAFDEGADPGDLITFRIGGVEAVSEVPLVWTENGDRIKVCHFLPSKCRNYSMAPGWHLISWNSMYEAPIEEFIELLDGCVEVIMSFEQGGLLYDPLLPDFSTLENVDFLHGYWIKTTCPTTLRVCGQEIPTLIWDGIFCKPGWNLVSYWPDSSLSIEDALSWITFATQVVIEYDNGATIWQPDGEFNSLQSMRPGLGYWIRVDQFAMLFYPGYWPPPKTSPRELTSVEPSLGSTQWMSLYGKEITLDGQPLANGSAIEVVTADGEVCGHGTYVDNRLRFLPVYGRDGFTSSAKLAGENQALTVLVNGAEVSPGVIWTGHGTKLELSVLKSSGGSSLPNNFALSQNYPNPFNPTTTIEFALPVAAEVRIDIYNIMGQRVKTIADEPYVAGYHTVEWDGRDQSGGSVATGIYFYRLSAGDFVQSRKMLLLK